jgi:hypothetical protein
LVDLISRKENAIDNIKTFALKDNLAFITINRLNHVDSSKTIQTSNDDSLFLNLSKDFNRSKFVDLPIKRITGEGNVIIYTKDSLNIRYSILEFKSSGGFGRVFYFVEVDPSQMSINYRNNLFVNEFKYGSYKIVKNHCKSYDLYHKILDGNSERTFIDVN